MFYFWISTDKNDYEEVNGEILSFDVSDIKKCHNISITEDSTCENDCDVFISNLSTNAYNVKIHSHMVEICIEDEEDCSK